MYERAGGIDGINPSGVGGDRRTRWFGSLYLASHLFCLYIVLKGVSHTVQLFHQNRMVYQRISKHCLDVVIQCDHPINVIIQEGLHWH